MQLSQEEMMRLTELQQMLGPLTSELAAIRAQEHPKQGVRERYWEYSQLLQKAGL